MYSSASLDTNIVMSTWNINKSTNKQTYKIMVDILWDSVEGTSVFTAIEIDHVQHT
jgi:hypothetical protein